MTLWEKAKAEFIDIIEWTDDSMDTMVYRFPRYENEIKYNAQLVVRQAQSAVFVNEGEVADVFEPGRHQLTTENLPVLTTLKGWKYGFHSPFKAEVYFVSRHNFTNLKWGTRNPVILRDPEYGPVRLRAFGTYVVKIVDPARFIREIAGTRGVFNLARVTEQLRNLIVSRFSDLLGEKKIPVLDLTANYDELSAHLTHIIAPEFLPYGLDISTLLVENISLPPEVEEAMDKRSSMGIVGNLDHYFKYQSANAMTAAAENPGGEASAGVGMGMGFAMANQMGQSLGPGSAQAGKDTAPPSPPPLPETPPVQYYIAVKGRRQGPYDDKKIRHNIQNGKIKPYLLMWRQGLEEWAKAADIPELAPLFRAEPPPVPPQ